MIGEFEYVRASSAKQAVAFLADGRGKVRVLAGGTDLLVEIRNQTASPRLLVDVKGIAALNRLSPTPRGGVSIGAAIPLNRLLEEPGFAHRYTGLYQAIQSLASSTVRNRATLAGNLAHASPAADSAPPLLALRASVVIEGPAGQRTLPVHELFAGVKRTTLTPDELIVSVELPPVPPTARTAFLKKQRIRGHDLAILNMAGYLDRETGLLRVAIGSCAPTPILLPAPRSSLDGPADTLVDELSTAAQEAISPIDDLRASAGYRRALVPVFVRRLIESLYEGPS
jgi:CO/xanthine dehydrogenase FAD-binding subunit